MKVTKIDICKKVMDVDRQEMHFAKIPNRLIDLGNLSDVERVNVERETYRVYKVFVPNEGIKNYLVKVDEIGLFNELLEISTGTLANRDSEVGKIVKDSVVSAIKRLPWYRRLFNKF